ncbi:hypothetical protein LSH36_111g01005 [Paralvinella palmiformis]|uniref:Uncharacterized protein n=1 Tax=Paralvinella palmiformis TaxID=53620 RepID=A0AAD9JZP5_9ANNE|nr:hypothetical protein LSH36_111g01005 [Paralvinella palmiformis]
MDKCCWTRASVTRQLVPKTSRTQEPCISFVRQHRH